MATKSKAHLLNDWDNRPPRLFRDCDGGKLLAKEINMLEALKEAGCQNTRDGLAIDEQLNERRVLFQENMRKLQGN